MHSRGQVGRAQQHAGHPWNHLQALAPWGARSHDVAKQRHYPGDSEQRSNDQISHRRRVGCRALGSKFAAEHWVPTLALPVAREFRVRSLSAPVVVTFVLRKKKLFPATWGPLTSSLLCLLPSVPLVSIPRHPATHTLIGAIHEAGPLKNERHRTHRGGAGAGAGDGRDNARERERERETLAIRWCN